MDSKEYKNRYTKEEREEFARIILNKIEKAKGDLIVLKESFVNDKNNGTEDTSPTFKAFEEGSETLSREQNAQLIVRLEKFIKNLESALMRTKSTDYGVCCFTGKLIDRERLKIVPHTTWSVEGKQLMEGK